MYVFVCVCVYAMCYIYEKVLEHMDKYIITYVSPYHVGVITILWCLAWCGLDFPWLPEAYFAPVLPPAASHMILHMFLLPVNVRGLALPPVASPWPPLGPPLPPVASCCFPLLRVVARFASRYLRSGIQLEVRSGNQAEQMTCRPPSVRSSPQVWYSSLSVGTRHQLEPTLCHPTSAKLHLRPSASIQV